MKKLSMLLVAAFLLAGCSNGVAEQTTQPTQTTETTREAYMNITQEEAKKLMDSEQDYIILDVRTQTEFDEKHIPGAILIPHDEIEERAEKELTDKGQLILVYCRSGNRSKTASEALEKLGYTYIREFGGINDWPYETE
ncbi:MAG: rhodanese-like domain-containing protein [Oscillospiraceae bacterium]|nr:rhodanese-like domain-containing protein [Oscillospiraceae bacterium]